MNPPAVYVTGSTSGGGEGGSPASTASTGGDGGGGGVVCTCAEGLTCCGGPETCVNLLNDPFNCGECGNHCAADQACIQGECRDACDPGFGCEEGICCGLKCCDATIELCCDYGTSADAPDLHCQTPVNGTCPLACSGCEED
ncbi:hypothetical protein [Sorangium sp. So ce131]|uniref:hypothetical protein n=1 Tax=Sorangium sp. So ce131 TaxID=3133282 RepID=UPI003F5DAA03